MRLVRQTLLMVCLLTLELLKKLVIQSQRLRTRITTLRGDTEFEYVEDHDAVAKYGIINKDIKAVGCYSQGQAHRLANGCSCQSRSDGDLSIYCWY